MFVNCVFRQLPNSVPCLKLSKATSHFQLDKGENEWKIKEYAANLRERQQAILKL